MQQQAYSFPSLNKTIPAEVSVTEEIPARAVSELQSALQRSLQLRCVDIRQHAALVTSGWGNGSQPAAVAVLFSGGLDCTVLARLLHETLAASCAIDLVNVAFENPRAHKSLSASESPYEACPDRKTAVKSHHELQSKCTRRRWNLVRVNVPYQETLTHRKTVVDLIRPHNTEMDISIAYALYFASRGVGTLEEDGAIRPYSSPSRVLLSGLGADELFGGYQRHSTAFSRHGLQGLLNELELDITRLGKRNLGRDDRVMSHWGKEVRFPYLDENLLVWALALPIWEKCGFGLELSTWSEDGLSGSMRDKRVLRLLAWKLGMHGVASEKKRAVRLMLTPFTASLANARQIQFGARTAKMEVGTVKGTQVLS